MLTRSPAGGITISPATARLNRRTIQNWLAQGRTREREAAGLGLYRVVLPTASLEAALEAERLLPKYPRVGREHVHRHEDVEVALTVWIMQKLCQR